MKIVKRKFSCKHDNLIIRGIEYRPNGDNLPIVIISHGFMLNRDSVKRYARYFARQGYAAYVFDFCGGVAIGGRSSNKTTKMTINTEIEDLKCVIEYTKILPYTDSSKINLMGCSQGGLVSALVATELKEEINNLILFYPGFSIPFDVRNGRMLWAKFDPEKPKNIIMCGPIPLGRGYVESVIKMDPYKEIVNYKGNILIIHGTMDKTVNIKYSEEAYNAYQKASPNKLFFYKVDGAGHNFNKEEDKVAFKVIETFLMNDK